MHRAAGNPAMTTYMVLALATMEAERGRYERAMRLYGAGEALYDTYANIAPADAIMMGDPVGAARAALGDEAVDAAIAEGKAMGSEAAIVLALEESG